MPSLNARSASAISKSTVAVAYFRYNATQLDIHLLLPVTRNTLKYFSTVQKQTHYMLLH